MPSLLLEIGCEELPASACYEAQEQLPSLMREHLGVDPSRLFVGPRRLGFLVDELPERTPDEWAKGPPVALRERAAAGFARKHGLAAEQLEEREGHLWALVPGRAVREVLEDRLRALVHGLQFGKSMRWDDGGHRFARPVRWICEKLDEETIGGGYSFGRRFAYGRIEIESAASYVDTLRGA